MRRILGEFHDPVGEIELGPPELDLTPLLPRSLSLSVHPAPRWQGFSAGGLKVSDTRGPQPPGLGPSQVCGLLGTGPCSRR